MSRRTREGAKPVTIDILAGSRILQAGRRWVADIHIWSGAWRAHASGSASNPATAAHRAVDAAWGGIRREQRREEGLDS